MTPQPPSDELAPEEQELLRWLEQADGGTSSLPGGSCPADLFDKLPRLPGILDCLQQLDELAVPRQAAPTISGSPSSVSRSPPLPRDFGPYELQRELGRGGMGVVYLARHRALDTHFALKMIRASEFASEEETRRFFQEAQAAARMRHAHIVSVHDAGEIEGCPYLVMQYVRGETLAQRLRRGRPTFEEIARLLREVALAVNYLHEQGIIHRDLKPSNLLIDERGQPHVTDFGLVKLFRVDGERTTTGAIIGTPMYMSPEQAWGRPDRIGPTCDLYSLGAILYEALTGRPPFQEANPLDQVLRLRDAEPRPPHALNRGIPEDLDQICLRCLEKDPRLRYQTGGELAADLDHYLRSEPITMPAISPWNRFRRWLRREPALVSHLIGFGLIALVEQVMSMFPGGPRPAYVPVMIVLAIWTVLAVILQQLLHREVPWVKLVWVAVDGVLFTLAVAFAEGPLEALVVGYALLIAASALWYQTSLVWLMTAVSVISYVLLIATRGPSPSPVPPHYPFMIAGILVVIGGVVASLVRRIRKLLHGQREGERGN